MEFRLPIDGDDQVTRLDIAMDHPLLEGMLQPFGRLLNVQTGVRDG